MPQLLTTLAIAVFLAACGLKGDLYLPDQEPVPTTIPEQQEQERQQRKDSTQQSPLISD